MKKKSRGARKLKVVVYSTEYCPWCKKTKEFLHENKIHFKEVDVGASEKAAREMVKKSKQQGVPVTLVNDTVIVGFDEAALRTALGLKKKGFKLW